MRTATTTTTGTTGLWEQLRRRWLRGPGLPEKDRERSRRDLGPLPARPFAPRVPPLVGAAPP